MITEQEIDLARAVANEAYTHYETLRTRWLEAEVEWGRLKLLEIADRDPSVTAFSWSIEYCYDDEGGYFESASASVVTNDEIESPEDVYSEDEVIDLNLGVELIRALCGDETSEDVEVTVQTLRAARADGG